MTSLTDLRPVFPNIVLMAGRPAERERDILRPEPARPHPHSLLITAGLIEDMEEEDNQRGYENADDAAFWLIVAGIPDYEDDVCGICNNWRCTCPQPSGAARPAPTSAETADRTALSSDSWQRNQCGDWFTRASPAQVRPTCG